MHLLSQCNIYNSLSIILFPVHFSIMEKFVEDYPNLINVAKDDGFTALHLAAINDNLDVVKLLAASVSVPVFIVCACACVSLPEWVIFYLIGL